MLYTSVGQVVIAMVVLNSENSSMQKEKKK